MNKLRFMIAGVVLLACPVFANNMLTNGGFENPSGTADFADAGWTNFTTTGSGIAREPWAAHTADRGGYFPMWNGANNNGGVYQTVTNNGGTNTFTMWVRQEQGCNPTNVLMMIEWFDVNTNLLSASTNVYQSVYTDEAWHQLYVTGTSPVSGVEFARVVLFAQWGAGSAAYMFDDGEFYSGGYTGVQTIYNGGFEKGSSSQDNGWRNSHWWTHPILNNVIGGGEKQDFAAHCGPTGLVLQGWNGNSNDWTSFMYQNVYHPGTGTYTFSIWTYREPQFLLTNVELRLEFYDQTSTNAVSDASVTNYLTPAGDGWHRLRVTGTSTNTETVEVRVCVKHEWHYSTNDAYLIDSAEFHEGPYTGTCDIANGSFEDGLVSSFRGTKWAAVPYDGARNANGRKDWARKSGGWGAALISFTNDNPGTGEPFVGSYTSMLCQAVYPASTGTFGFAIHMAREGNFTLNTALVQMVGYDASLTNIVCQFENSANVPADGVWREYYVNGTCNDPDLYELRCYLYAEYDVTVDLGGSQAFFVDDARFFKGSAYDGVPFFTTNCSYYNDSYNQFPRTVEKVPTNAGVFLAVNYTTGTNTVYVITETDGMVGENGQGGYVGLRYFWTKDATTENVETNMAHVGTSVIDSGAPFHGVPSSGAKTVDVWCVQFPQPLTNGSPVIDVDVLYNPYICLTNADGPIMTWHMVRTNGLLTNALGQAFFPDFRDRDYGYKNLPRTIPSELQDGDFNDPMGLNTFTNIEWTGFGGVERPSWAAREGENGVGMQTWAANNGGIYQDVATTGGVYTTTAWMKREPFVDMNTAELKIEWFTSLDELAQVKTQSIVNLPSDGRWHRICLTATGTHCNIAFLRLVLFGDWNNQSDADYSATMIDDFELYSGQFTNVDFFKNGRFRDPDTTNGFLLAKWDGVPSSFNDSNNSVGVESWADLQTPSDLSTFGVGFKSWRTNRFLATLSQAMYVPTGTYVLSSWLRREGNVNTTNVIMRIEWYDKTLTNKVCADSITNLLTALPNDSQWYNFCVTGTCTSADLFEMRPVIEMGWAPGSDNAITVDDVHVARLGEADGDYDGMLDEWEIANFGTIAAWPDDDSDTNGFDNLSEYYADTEPTNAMSFLAADGGGTTNTAFTIDPSSTGRIYGVYYKTNLLENADWMFTGVSAMGTGGALMLTVTNELPGAFYTTGSSLP